MRAIEKKMGGQGTQRGGLPAGGPREDFPRSRDPRGEGEGPGRDCMREGHARQRAQPGQRPWGRTRPGLLEEQQEARVA